MLIRLQKLMTKIQKTFFSSTINKNFKKVLEFILRNKNVINFSVHESLFHKYKN